MSAIFQSFYMIPTAPNDPQALGAATIQFNSAVFLGLRAKDTYNANRIFIESGGTSVTIFPGVSETWSAPLNSYATAADFSVRVQTPGDGVLCLYLLANPKSFSDIEMSLESACIRYLKTIGSTLDDCSFTSGISMDERTEDNINVHVSTATERIIGSRVFDCDVRVEVRSQVGKADEENRYDRHRLRTSYVRDMMLADEAALVLSSLQHSLSVFNGSIRDVVCENEIEDRTWVSGMTFTCTVSNTNLK
jgi:hypothetical protein